MTAQDFPLPVEVVRHPRARRLRLSLCRARGIARLTVPAGVSQRAALAWAGEQRAWLQRLGDALPQPRPFRDGMALTVADRPLTIAWHPQAPRQPQLADDRLIVGGPAERLATRITQWLRREAQAVMARDVAAYCARAGIAPATLRIADPRGRWGSCSSTGTIMLSWRLILAPGHVRRAVAAHEVAHRLHMNHSPAFHAALAQLIDGDDPRRAMAWLRAHGPALHWLGREP